MRTKLLIGMFYVPVLIIAVGALWWTPALFIGDGLMLVSFLLVALFPKKFRITKSC